MIVYKFGDVVLVPFPFTDQSAVKRRPAVVIQQHRLSPRSPGHRDHGHHQSTAQTLSLGEVQVQDWQGAGLIKPSVLKPVLTTIDPLLILKNLGQLTPADQALLRQALAQIIG